MGDDETTARPDEETSEEQSPGEQGLDDEGSQEQGPDTEGSDREESDADRSPADHEPRSLTDEERAEIYRQQLKELRLLDVARDMMLTVVTVGYQKLGLTDETRELRDLDDAHLAIELLRAVIGALEGVAEQDELETYRSTLAQMQLNYARVAGD